MAGARCPAPPCPPVSACPGPRRVDGSWRYGLPTAPDHGNNNGVVHGGVLMAFADHGLSFLAWEAADRAPCTTIQLNTHFLDAIMPGEFIELRGEVTRRTRGLVFVRGVIGALNAGGDARCRRGRRHLARSAGALAQVTRRL